MRIASNVLLIFYGFLMLMPLFSKRIDRITKGLLLLCESLTFLHLILYFTECNTTPWILLTALLSFQAFAVFQGIKQQKIHWHHQILRLILHIIIFLFFLFD